MKKFFRVLSLFLVYIVFFGCLQGIAFAAEPIQVSIPTLSDGVVFTEGASIPLQVFHNSETKTISHVDFYANNAKLPGTILSGEESKILMWNNPTVGEYKVYARIHYIGGGVYDSDKITVIIRPDKSGSILTEPMIATPEIPNGQQNVSYDLSAYRIHFNHSLAHFLTEDKLTGITLQAGNEIVELDYEIGTCYLDLVPRGHENLEIEKTYVVTIPEDTLCDAAGNKVPGQTFTFSTVKTLANRATPIPSVSYPANGAVVPATGAELAAKVLFPPESASDVNFYDNGELIAGTVIKGTDGEFILGNVSLSEGEHSISVSVWKNGETVSSEAITLTAAESSYAISGIDEGETVYANELGYQLQVALTDAEGNAVTDLKKAVFKINGRELAATAEAPFAGELPLTSLGAQILAVEITDFHDAKQTIFVPFHVQFRSNGVASQKLVADAGMPAEKAAVINPGKLASYVLYEAVYNADGTLKSTTEKAVDILANEIKVHTPSVTVEEGETVRLFTWTKELMPLY